MNQSKPLFTKVVMSALTAALSSFAVLGNGSILALIARFKSLRTVPNVLIGNLAVVDLLNAVIYMPIQITYAVLEVNWYRGQSLAIATSFLNRLFAILNLGSMLALMANMYFAIGFDLKYFAWKTNKKAVVCACLVWLISTVMAVLSSIPQFRVERGDAPVREYRQKFFKNGRYVFAAFLAFCIIVCAVLGFLTIWSIRKKKKKIVEMNLPALQAQSRLQSDIKATKTIAITVAAYFACYVPTIAYTVAGQQDGSKADIWFSFFAWFARFSSSALNPIIYYLRSARFRYALKQLIKDPFGSSDLKKKPSSPGKAREKRNPEGAVTQKKSGNEGDGLHDEDNVLKNYQGQRRGGLMILSMQALQAHLCASDDRGNSGEGRPKQQKEESPGSTSSSPEPVIEQREAGVSNHQIKEPNEDKCEEIEELFLAELDDGSQKERNLPGELAGKAGYRPKEKRKVPAQCPGEEIPQQASSSLEIQESTKNTPMIVVDKFREVLEERGKTTED